MKNILLSIPGITDESLARMLDICKDNSAKSVKPSEVTAEDVTWADIIIGNVSPDFLKNGKPEFVQLTSAGADLYVAPGILNKGTKLACCSGAYNQSVAEHGFAATLMLQKDLHLYRDSQLNCTWNPEGTVGTINGATVIVMGLGEIGKYYAQMAKALGAYVIGVKRTAGEKPDCVDELYTTDCFDDIAGRADVIFSVLPGTPSTTHFYTEERFRLMKSSVIFINCGRGNTVSSEVLYKVLSENIISCAAVDVFEQEPLPASSPLWGLKNLLVTPHASGFYHLPATLGRVVDICATNLSNWLNGNPIINEIDFDTGYKK